MDQGDDTDHEQAGDQEPDADIHRRFDHDDSCTTTNLDCYVRTNSKTPRSVPMARPHPTPTPPPLLSFENLHLTCVSCGPLMALPTIRYDTRGRSLLGA